jgi:hypothetical protein
MCSQLRDKRYSLKQLKAEELELEFYKNFRKTEKFLGSFYPKEVFA